MILFIIQPFSSHYYPAFKLAQNLRDQGNEVLFTTTPFLNELVADHGFGYNEFQYLSEYMIKSPKSFLGLLLKNLVSKELLQTRQREFESAHVRTKELVETVNPTRVYLDQSLADYYFFLKPYVQKITILHTKFYSGKVKGIPPMNSRYIPNNTWLSKKVCDWKWFRLFSKQRWKELLLKIAFLGKDEAYLWKKHCENHGMNWSNQTDFRHALNRGIKNIDTIVLAPEGLEFSNFKSPINLRFQDELSKKNESKYFSRKYWDFKTQHLTPKRKTIVYLAFGTLAMGNPKIVSFFNDVLSIVDELKDTMLIISTGKIQMKLKPTENSIIFDFVPQLDVLTYTDLFITHGGLGSVKEAYHTNVPMLVVPFNRKTDMPGNAARVKARGLGDYLNLEQYSKKELEQKIIKLLFHKELKPISLYPIKKQLV